MKQLVLALLMSLLILSPSLAAAAEKIGYINLQRILLESDPGKEAKNVISAKVKDLETQVKSKQEELKKLKDELEKQGVMLTPEVKAQKERDYQTKVKDYQRFAKDSQEQLQQQDGEYTRRILKEVIEVVRELGKTEGYDLILEKNESSLVYASETLDLTDKVIAAYNAKLKKAK